MLKFYGKNKCLVNFIYRVFILEYDILPLSYNSTDKIHVSRNIKK